MPVLTKRTKLEDGEATDFRKVTHSTTFEAREALTSALWKESALRVVQPPVRSSSFACLRECPRKFLFRERLGLRRNTYRPALAIGDTFHQLVAEVYRGASMQSLAPTAARITRERLDALSAQVDKATGMLPSGETYASSVEKIDKDVKLALAMVALFFEFYPLDVFLKTYEVVAVEMPCAIRVPEIPSPLAIQIDLLVRNRTTGEFWIIDHKTAGRSPKSVAETKPFEFQPRLYKFVWANYEAAGNGGTFPPLGGVIHNIIQKPGIRFCAKDKGDFDAYVRRCREWYEEQVRLNPNDPPVLQSIVRHQGPLLDDELLLQILTHSRASRAKLSLSRFFRDDHSCNRVGSGACEFLALCRTDHRLKDWPDIIRSLYIQDFRSWSSEEEPVG